MTVVVSGNTSLIVDQKLQINFIMIRTAKENDINDILKQDQCSSIANALMMAAGVTDTSAKCRLYLIR